MNILICGAGKGSWQMRGVQLGEAIGARVTTAPTDADFAWCDLVVLIKKHAATFAPRAHAAGKPIVWDALDFWSQPIQNSYTPEAARLALANQIKFIKPALVIGATEAMAEAARMFAPAAYLPHHSWTGLAPTPAREHVATVAYEGNAGYLGRWHGWLSSACEKRGWSFVVNPPNLAEADIIVAFRDGVWDGWICREWKSGVKVVNAIAAGRPLLSQNSAAYREIDPEPTPIEAQSILDDALDEYECAEIREAAARAASQIAPRYTLGAVSKCYREILSTVGAA